MATKAPTRTLADSVKAPEKVTKLKVAVAEKTDADDGAAKSADTLKIKELVDRVVATSGVSNRKNVRQVVEATLLELVKALQAGEVTNLPGVGRLRVANQRDDEAALFMTLKLRRPRPKAAGENDAKQALADDGEDS